MSLSLPSPREAAGLRRQRRLSQLLSPLWVPGLVAIMRLGFGYRIEGTVELRREYARLRAESRAPLLICPNHLTMVDSFLVAWALGSPAFFLGHFSALPWNTPERTRFASRPWSRILAYVLKCVPITRGSDRREIGRVLERVRGLLAAGDAVLMFPEGGRSRTGRVEIESAAHGVGRLVSMLPGCRVLCVYLRGDGQVGPSDLPHRGERFRVRAECFEPKADRGGVRGSVDLARQIVTRLARLEEEVLHDRK